MLAVRYHPLLMTEARGDLKIIVVVDLIGVIRKFKRNNCESHSETAKANRTERLGHAKKKTFKSN